MAAGNNYRHGKLRKIPAQPVCGTAPVTQAVLILSFSLHNLLN
jgi:hypothetical protein